MASFSKKYDKGSPKKFLWASRLWVGRWKKPIAGYDPKNDKKKKKKLRRVNFEGNENSYIRLTLILLELPYNII